MIDINKDIETNIDALNVVARTILGDATAGVSTGNGSTIHLVDESDSAQVVANSILDNWSTLPVTADSTTIDEGADATITCVDVSIANDTDIGYVVLLDEELYDAGTDTVTGGTASLILSQPVNGVYKVYMYRLVDNYSSGYVIITVNEVV